ncbi:E3 ubiquitin-protein ligase Mdm2-like isoform X1 [Polyodon spathula]|uniref:E3 ubiquitin-protein ligase Mdm2-like isoform X1 n=2 Tax=Polyodon spathula TaxID=7913 RepID=UPI001B7EE06D|nr:E3 ubiquitin-protein ligase Mdm2-like isoform X1 [Polyodon spathula]
MYIVCSNFKGITMATSTENCLSNSLINTPENEKLVKPKAQLLSLLRCGGAEKDIFTMKEVMFYLGQYIMDKELYDKKQQHIVHCSSDLLGDVLGVHSFSVKEPRVLYAMISKNLIAVKNPDLHIAITEPRCQSETDRGPEVSGMDSNEENGTACSPATSGRRRRKSNESDNTSADDDIDEKEESEQRRKRHKSDSISLTFDDSLSWCVIGGLRRGHGSCESSSDSPTNPEADIVSGSEDSDETWFSQDSDSDHFSVEFEVESVHSDTYSQNEEAQELTDEDDEVYEVTIFEAEDDSFDEDTEISEADYWKCSKCDELNPPLPGRCHRCWSLRKDWFPEFNNPKSWNAKSAALDKRGLEEGIDVPDGKRIISDPSCGSTLDVNKSKDVCSLEDCATSASKSQETLSSLPSTSSTSNSQEETPELEREISLEPCLPQSSLEPCVICQSRPKNGCIVHGKTGHLMACYTCAKKLKKRNKLCPVCRQPIQMVVLTYFS